jgi:hypothetical protein
MGSFLKMFMVQPPGFVYPTFSKHVCKLQKAIYGLKQALRAWFSRLGDKLLQLGFVGSKADTSLYLSHQDYYYVSSYLC